MPRHRIALVCERRKRAEDALLPDALLESMMAYLEIRIAQQARRFSLDRDHLRIGRLAENEIVLRDAQISRQHAEMRCISGRWRILDLGSTNGIHVKGKRVGEHELSNGDLILLAPNVTLSFFEGAAPPDAVSTGSGLASPAAHPPQPQPQRQPQSQAAPASAQAAAPAMPATPRPSAAAAEPPMFDLLRPRSPFADDEQPYYPPGIGMPAPPTLYSRPHAPGASHGFPPPSEGHPIAQPPTASSAPQMDTIPAGGYPAPMGPLTSGGDGQDPFRRSGPNIKSEAHRTTAGPSSTLLHVCQTCGQLTAPDSVYCQSCHHSIARECTNCRFSLLPIQDRCPRCQTPNPGSVRRAHRAPSA